MTRTMPKSGQTEKQMVGMLRQVEAGARVDDVCRKVGISQAIHIAKQVWRPRRLYLVPLEVVGFTKQQSIGSAFGSHVPMPPSRVGFGFTILGSK